MVATTTAHSKKTRRTRSSRDRRTRRSSTNVTDRCGRTARFFGGKPARLGSSAPSTVRPRLGAGKTGAVRLVSIAAFRARAEERLRPRATSAEDCHLAGPAAGGLTPRRHRLRGADLLPSAMPETEDPPPAEQDALELGLVAVRNAGGSKGKGLFALADIPEGTFIGEYTGQVLTEEAYLQRYPDADPEYAFEVNDNYIIDAVNPEQSSFLRYANHCPDADSNLLNTVFRKKRQRHKEVKFFASRSIASGEELQFDYGEQFWMRRKHLLASQPAVVSYEYFCDGCGTDVKDGAQCHVCPECKEDLFILCPSCFTSANAGLNDELLAATMHEHTLVMTTRASEYDPDVIAQTT